MNSQNSATELFDRCEAIFDVLLAAGFMPVVLEPMREMSFQALKKGKITYLRKLERELLEFCSVLPEASRLDLLARLGISEGSDTTAAVEKALKSKKITTNSQFRLILEHVDSLVQEGQNIERVRRLNELLLAYETKMKQKLEERAAAGGGIKGASRKNRQE